MQIYHSSFQSDQNQLVLSREHPISSAFNRCHPIFRDFKSLLLFPNFLCHFVAHRWVRYLCHVDYFHDNRFNAYYAVSRSDFQSGSILPIFPTVRKSAIKCEKSGATWEIWSRRIIRQKLPVIEILNGSNFYQESSSPGMWSVYPLVAVFYPPTVPYSPESALLTKVWFFFDFCVIISSWWVIFW